MSFHDSPRSHPDETLSTVGERGLLSRLTHYMAPEGGRLVVGYGDDAAVWDPDPDNPHSPLLIVTMDTMVEGTHFRTEWATWEEVGGKLVASNISDIAAMGGRPTMALVSLSCPSSTSTRSIESLYNGMQSVLREWNTVLIGGDTVRGDPVTLTLTVFGERDRNAASCRRDALSPGQHLYVTGWPGESGAGLSLLQSGGYDSKTAPDWIRHLVSRHLLPSPRPKVGWELARAFSDLSMIDISDGVDSELHILSEMSNALLSVDLEALPVSPALRRLKESNPRIDPVEMVLFGGEDYELLFSTNADREAVSRVLTAADPSLSVHEIGRVVAKEPHGRVKYLDPSGHPHDFKNKKGFEHFRDSFPPSSQP